MTNTQAINTTCPICGTTNTVHVDPVGYKLWKTGETLIQDALSHLHLNEREQLMTGICGRCWETCFAEQPAEDEYEMA